jgi:hypothetical protein
MIRGILYIVIFTAGVAAGGLFPSFSTQYHQRLQAQHEQVNLDLAPFQSIADRYHSGDLDALIQHHLNSTDPTFHAEGEAIRLMIDSRELLAESQSASQASYTNQAFWLYQHRNESVVRATWESFQPTVIATSNAITFSLAAGGIIVLLLWLVFTAISYSLSHLFTSKHN